MKVTVTRSGGFAGIARRWQVSVEQEPDEESWIMLLRRLPWDEVPQEPAQPDRYLYRINCEPRQDGQDDGERSNRRESAIAQPREAVIPEQRLTGPWRELVDRVRERDELEHQRRPSHSER
ncbi:protealysin inhibitor emfourin [Mycetocola sp. 2940]|uniref:protealysin inhibitor emfourin n=1 Tax=Mycetocola sp. 2940 TaxID=3156452 RepID=UPI0033929EB8